MRPELQSGTATDQPADGPAEPGSAILIGTDLVAVERIARLIQEQPGLAGRVFTERELAYCAGRRRRESEHLAARFAAKEAVLKALGTGLAAGIEWTDIEVVNRVDGRPVIHLYGGAAEAAARLNVEQALISLSHAAGMAVAHAVLVTTPAR